MIRPARIADDLVTFDEFCSLVGDGQKADLIDGVIYMASPDSRRSNELTSFLAFLLRGYVAARRKGGEVFVSRFAFAVSDLRAPEPDVAYVAPQRVHLIEERAMFGGPTIAVEIVSRDSRARDYGEKKQLYLDAGVEEYWIIDPLARRVEFHRLVEGHYDVVALSDNRVFRSEALPGFWLDVDWLLAKPLPNDYECLQRILNEKPTVRRANRKKR